MRYMANTCPIREHAHSLVEGVPYALWKWYAIYLDAWKEYIQVLQEKRVFKLLPGGRPLLITLEAAGFAAEGV